MKCYGVYNWKLCLAWCLGTKNLVLAIEFELIVLFCLAGKFYVARVLF